MNEQIENRYEAALAEALKLLGSLEIAQGPPKHKILGLNGWIFEQTLRCVVEEELKREKIQYYIREQETIEGRAKVDLIINRVAIEIKLSGFYSNVEEKYVRFRQRLEERGLIYFYVTLYEEYERNFEVAKRVFGANRAFILIKPGDWERFTRELIDRLIN